MELFNLIFMRFQMDSFTSERGAAMNKRLPWRVQDVWVPLPQIRAEVLQQ
jgi:hypothetical protein